MLVVSNFTVSFLLQARGRRVALLDVRQTGLSNKCSLWIVNSFDAVFQLRNNVFYKTDNSLDNPSESLTYELFLTVTK